MLFVIKNENFEFLSCFLDFAAKLSAVSLVKTLTEIVIRNGFNYTKRLDLSVVCG